MDRHRTVRATQVLPEGEMFEPPPWIRQKVESEGWTIGATEYFESGINDHGHADWFAVSQELATQLRVCLNSPEDLDEVAAMAALDAYDIAIAEVSLSLEREGQPPEEHEEPPDGE